MRSFFPILAAISFCHFLNDLIQSLLPAIYPILRDSFHLSFTEVGLITFTYQLTASLLQPFIGLYTDKKPKPYSLPIGMGFTLAGLLLLSVAPNFPLLLLSAALVGTGSSVFHPESSRVARLASGGKHGFAQSFFQVGGNTGSAIGPLAAAYFILPRGQGSLAWFALAALLGMVVLARVGSWYKRHHVTADKKRVMPLSMPLPKNKVMMAVMVLAALVFTKFFYLASLSSYYTFYLISTFHFTGGIVT